MADTNLPVLHPPLFPQVFNGQTVENLLGLVDLALAVYNPCFTCRGYKQVTYVRNGEAYEDTCPGCGGTGTSMEQEAAQ